MLWYLRTLFALASIAVPALIGLEAQQSEGTSERKQGEGPTVNKRPDASIAKYATDECFAACYLRPNELAENTFFNTLPLNTIVPSSLSLGRLTSNLVTEFVVFAGPVTHDKKQRWNQQNSQFQLSAAARLSRPINFDELLERWRRSLAPKQAGTIAEPEIVRIDQRECFRVPAGTFLNSRRIYGELRFTDRSGQASEKGINIGKIYEYRGYVEGATNASAIFTLTNLKETDLIDGFLPLEMRVAVFRTYQLGREFSSGQIVLRNPESKLRSEPLLFEAESYANRELRIPRKLTAVDANGKSRQVDLIEDLVSKKRLEVILKGNDRAVYLGVGENDLNVKTSAAEYVFVSGHEIVVAQSPLTLSKMLRGSEVRGSLAQRLSRIASDMTIVIHVRDESQQKAVRNIIRVFGDQESAVQIGESIVDVAATMRMDEPVVARMTVELTNEKNADRLRRQINRALLSFRNVANNRIDEFVDGGDPVGSLLSMASDGVSMKFPELDLPPRETRRQLRSIVAELLTSAKVESKKSTLTLHFTQPRLFSRLPKSAQFALAWLDEKHAKSLFDMERFDLGDESYHRVTDRLPLFPETWFRRAHHLSYNMSVEFDGYATRYSWVRRGVDVLLDGADRNANTMDLIWMAGKFIGYKIGLSDEHAQYRMLFSNDRLLHDRLAKFIAIDKARSPEISIDNWLVAKMLFQYCIDQHTRFGTPFSIPSILFFSQPCSTQAHYAQSLDEAGHWDAAAGAWAESERMYRELGDRIIELPSSQEIRLNDLQKRLADYGPADAKAKVIRTGRHWIQYDHWLTRCRLEQSDRVRSARKLAHDADQHFRQSDLSGSLELYGQSLQALAEKLNEQPKQMQLIADEFRYVLDGYRRVATLLKEQDDQSLKAIVKSIESSQPRPIFPLLERQQ